MLLFSQSFLAKIVIITVVTVSFTFFMIGCFRFGITEKCRFRTVRLCDQHQNHMVSSSDNALARCFIVGGLLNANCLGGLLTEHC